MAMVMAITIITEARRLKSNSALETKTALMRKDDARVYFLGDIMKRGCGCDVC